jgi:leader peptidase (prepilin peptidase)/N-methyltransferase
MLQVLLVTASTILVRTKYSVRCSPQRPFSGALFVFDEASMRYTIAMIVTMAGIIGLCIGSFLSVVVARLGRQEGIITGRSECPECHVQLAWYELIPVASFVLLRRRCRHCAAPIPWSYVVFEIFSAIAFASFAWQHGTASAPEILFGAGTLLGLLALLFFDYRYFLLPDMITLPLGLFALGYRIIESPTSLPVVLVTSFVASGIFGILYLVSHGTWVGFGDVKLVFVIGLLFGYPLGPAVILMSIWLGALVGIALLAMRRATGQTALPFGSLAAFVAIVIVIFPYEPTIITRLFL